MRPAPFGLQLGDVRGLEALGPLHHFEFHRRALLETAVAVSLDGGKVDEDVFTSSALDEAVALAGVKPLHGALFSVTHVCIYSLLVWCCLFSATPQG